MRVCPRCNKAARESERIEADKEVKGKNWLITYCAKCTYNFDLEVYTGEVLSPVDELNKYQYTAKVPKYWPYA